MQSRRAFVVGRFNSSVSVCASVFECHVVCLCLVCSGVIWLWVCTHGKKKMQRATHTVCNEPVSIQWHLQFVDVPVELHSKSSASNLFVSVILELRKICIIVLYECKR